MFWLLIPLSASAWAPPSSRGLHPTTVPPKAAAAVEEIPRTKIIPGRRTLRSRFTELCVRGWIREVRKRGRLVIGELEPVHIVEKDECEIFRCPDVIRVAATDVSWMVKGEPFLQLKSLDWEFVNLVSRILKKGKVGSMVAKVAASGANFDASSIWKRFLLETLAPQIAQTATSASTIIADRRITVNFFNDKKYICSVSCTIEAVDGKLNFKVLDLDFTGTIVNKIFETVGETLFSSVFLDATTALYVEDLDFHHDTVRATIKSEPPPPVKRKKIVDLNPVVVKKDDEDVRFGRTEPRRDVASIIDAHRDAASIFMAPVAWPLRLWPVPTYTVRTQQLPWLLDASSSAPRLVVASFGLLAVFIHLFAQTDNLISGSTWLVKALLRLLTRGLRSITKTLTTSIPSLLRIPFRGLRQATSLFFALRSDNFFPSSTRWRDRFRCFRRPTPAPAFY